VTGVRARLGAATARRDIRLLGVVVLVELCLLALYFLVTPGRITAVRYTLYPFVWVNVGAWAVVHTDPPPASGRRRLAAGALAVGYLVVLSYLAGLVGPAATPASFDLRVSYGSPGWQSLTVIAGDARLTLVPFRTVGYLSLAYLVYVTVLDVATSALSGALGLVSCVSCTFPVLASLAAGVFGSSAALTGAIYAYSMDLSTAVFLLAVVLLCYRPGFGSRLGQRME